MKMLLEEYQTCRSDGLEVNRSALTPIHLYTSNRIFGRIPEAKIYYIITAI